jgi:hypothetical protein
MIVSRRKRWIGNVEGMGGEMQTKYQYCKPERTVSFHQDFQPKFCMNFHFPMRVTLSTHHSFKILDLIPLAISGTEVPHYIIFPYVLSLPFCSTLCLRIPSICFLSSARVRNQVSYPHRRKGNITVFCIIIFKFLYIKLERWADALNGSRLPRSITCRYVHMSQTYIVLHMIGLMKSWVQNCYMIHDCLIVLLWL